MTRIKMISVYFGIALLLLALSPAPAIASYPSQVYFNDFDGGLIVTPGVTGTLAGITSTESVQGYNGLGTGSNTFGGNFLRNTTGGYAAGLIGTPGSPTTLTLSGLPAHTSIDINFLLAIIDSWDGSEPDGCTNCHPDILTLTVDGTTIFSEAFGFNGPVFDPPPGIQLIEHAPLGFNPDFEDVAYDMGLNPTFDGIPHTASTLTIEWVASGAGWQGVDDESWAIDNIEIVLAQSILDVNIDIKPDSDPNSINCYNENEVITVALLTTDDFNALSVEHSTVIFAGASETHVNKTSGLPKKHVEDVDGDGDLDLVFHFRLGATDLTCASAEGILSGQTLDGTPVVGIDAIRMLTKDRCVLPPEGLVSWWPGDGHADDIADENNGLLIGDATFAPGFVGQAFSFDGDGDYVKVPRAPNLDMAAQQLTIELWMKADPSNLMEDCCQGLVTTDFYEFGIAPGAGWENGVILMVAADGWVHSSDLGDGGYPVAPGEWYHVAGVYDGSSIRLYVDGQLVNQPPSQMGYILPMLETSFLAIGSEDGRTNEPNLIGTRYFHGLLDEVNLYSRALSESEILTIYNAGSLGKCK